MKFKTTKKEVNNGYMYKILIPYASLQYLLTYDEPVAYISNKLGWRADIYHLNGQCCIVTGHEPFGNIRPNIKMIRDYEIVAEAIIRDRDIPSYSKRERLHNLKMQFIADCIHTE